MSIYHNKTIGVLLQVIISTTNNMTKSTAYNPVLPWLQDGLLMSTGKTALCPKTLAIILRSLGQKWHARRKMLTPTFHFNILQQFIPIFFRQARVTIKKLAGSKAEEGFDVTQYLPDFTLRVICGKF